MYNYFWYEIFIMLPTPILNFLGLNYDKNEYYSSGDLLKSLSENRHPRIHFNARDMSCIPSSESTG